MARDDNQLAMIQPTHAPEGAICLAPHPGDPGVKCRRLAGHDGEHSAFTYSIRTPTTWTVTGSGDTPLPGRTR